MKTTTNVIVSAVAFLTVSFLILSVPLNVEGCNEAICASVVSKCMLTQSCKCDLSNCSCCLECSQCLSNYYAECCSCVDLCPTTNHTHDSDLSKKSHVEDFPQNFPQLFQELTKEPDTEGRWDSFTVEIILKSKRIENEVKEFQSLDEETQNGFGLNCTVAYFAQCMPYGKCKINCQSIGATSYRWFHDGCCECIGDTCINYGINENKCRLCPNSLDYLPEESLEDDELDYGGDLFKD